MYTREYTSVSCLFKKITEDSFGRSVVVECMDHPVYVCTEIFKFSCYDPGGVVLTFEGL